MGGGGGGVCLSFCKYFEYFLLLVFQLYKHLVSNEVLVEVVNKHCSINNCVSSEYLESKKKKKRQHNKKNKSKITSVISSKDSPSCIFRIFRKQKKKDNNRNKSKNLHFQTVLYTASSILSRNYIHFPLFINFRS